MAETTIGPMTTLAAEGARIGVAACQECGAAIMLDPREEFDPVKRHREWHAATSPRSEGRL